MDRLYKTPVETETWNQQKVQYEVLTDIAQTVQKKSVRSDMELTDGSV